MYVCSGTPQEELQSVLEQRGLARYFTGICGTPPAKAELLKGIVRKERSIPPTRSCRRRHHGQRRRRSRRDAVLRARPLLREYRLPPRFRSDRTQPLAGRARGEGIRDWRGKGKLSEESPPTFPLPLQTARGARSTPILFKDFRLYRIPVAGLPCGYRAGVPASGLESPQDGAGASKSENPFPTPKTFVFWGRLCFYGEHFFSKPTRRRGCLTLSEPPQCSEPEHRFQNIAGGSEGVGGICPKGRRRRDR